MKAFLAALFAAAALAIAAAVVLDTEVQRSAADHFQTEGVRL